MGPQTGAIIQGALTSALQRRWALASSLRPAAPNCGAPERLLMPVCAAALELLGAWLSCTSFANGRFSSLLFMHK